MGFATHLGPWLLGTIKNTTGTTVGQNVANVGPTVSAQTTQVNYAGITTAGTTNTIAVLPAGSQIISIHVDTTTAFTGSTAANMTIGDGTTANLYWTTTDITSAGRLATTNAQLVNWAGATSTAAPNGIGIGPVDVGVVVTLTPTVATVTAGIVQFTILYTVRNSNGAPTPSTFQN